MRRLFLLLVANLTVVSLVYSASPVKIKAQDTALFVDGSWYSGGFEPMQQNSTIQIRSNSELNFCDRQQKHTDTAPFIKLMDYQVCTLLLAYTGCLEVVAGHTYNRRVAGIEVPEHSVLYIFDTLSLDVSAGAVRPEFRVYSSSWSYAAGIGGSAGKVGANGFGSNGMSSGVVHILGGNIKTGYIGGGAGGDGESGLKGADGTAFVSGAAGGNGKDGGHGGDGGEIHVWRGRLSVLGGFRGGDGGYGGRGGYGGDRAGVNSFGDGGDGGNSWGGNAPSLFVYNNAYVRIDSFFRGGFAHPGPPPVLNTNDNGNLSYAWNPDPNKSYLGGNGKGTEGNCNKSTYSVSSGATVVFGSRADICVEQHVFGDDNEYTDDEYTIDGDNLFSNGYVIRDDMTVRIKKTSFGNDTIYGPFIKMENGITVRLRIGTDSVSTTVDTLRFDSRERNYYDMCLLEGITVCRARVVYRSSDRSKSLAECQVSSACDVDTVYTLERSGKLAACRLNSGMCYIDTVFKTTGNLSVSACLLSNTCHIDTVVFSYTDVEHNTSLDSIAVTVIDSVAAGIFVPSESNLIIEKGVLKIVTVGRGAAIGGNGGSASDSVPLNLKCELGWNTGYDGVSSGNVTVSGSGTRVYASRLGGGDGGPGGDLFHFVKENSGGTQYQFDTPTGGNGGAGGSIVVEKGARLVVSGDIRGGNGGDSVVHDVRDVGVIQGIMGDGGAAPKVSVDSVSYLKAGGIMYGMGKRIGDAYNSDIVIAPGAVVEVPDSRTYRSFAPPDTIRLSGNGSGDVTISRDTNLVIILNSYTREQGSTWLKVKPRYTAKLFLSGTNTIRIKDVSLGTGSEEDIYERNANHEQYMTAGIEVPNGARLIIDTLSSDGRLVISMPFGARGAGIGGRGGMRGVDGRHGARSCEDLSYRDVREGKVSPMGGNYSGDFGAVSSRVPKAGERGSDGGDGGDAGFVRIDGGVVQVGRIGGGHGGDGGHGGVGGDAGHEGTKTVGSVADARSVNRDYNGDFRENNWHSSCGFCFDGRPGGDGGRGGRGGNAGTVEINGGSLAGLAGGKVNITGGNSRGGAGGRGGIRSCAGTGFDPGRSGFGGDAAGAGDGPMLRQYGGSLVADNVGPGRGAAGRAGNAAGGFKGLDGRNLREAGNGLIFLTENGSIDNCSSVTLISGEYTIKRGQINPSGYLAVNGAVVTLDSLDSVKLVRTFLTVPRYSKVALNVKGRNIIMMDSNELHKAALSVSGMLVIGSDTFKTDTLKVINGRRSRAAAIGGNGGEDGENGASCDACINEISMVYHIYKMYNKNLQQYSDRYASDGGHFGLPRYNHPKPRKGLPGNSGQPGASGEMGGLIYVEGNVYVYATSVGGGHGGRGGAGSGGRDYDDGYSGSGGNGAYGGYGGYGGSLIVRDGYVKVDEIRGGDGGGGGGSGSSGIGMVVNNMGQGAEHNLKIEQAAESYGGDLSRAYESVVEKENIERIADDEYYSQYDEAVKEYYRSAGFEVDGLEDISDRSSSRVDLNDFANSGSQQQSGTGTVVDEWASVSQEELTEIQGNPQGYLEAIVATQVGLDGDELKRGITDQVNNVVNFDDIGKMIPFDPSNMMPQVPDIEAEIQSKVMEQFGDITEYMPAELQGINPLDLPNKKLSEIEAMLPAGATVPGALQSMLPEELRGLTFDDMPAELKDKTITELKNMSSEDIKKYLEKQMQEKMQEVKSEIEEEIEEQKQSLKDKLSGDAAEANEVADEVEQEAAPSSADEPEPPGIYSAGGDADEEESVETGLFGEGGISVNDPLCMMAFADTSITPCITDSVCVPVVYPEPMYCSLLSACDDRTGCLPDEEEDEYYEDEEETGGGSSGSSSGSSSRASGSGRSSSRVGMPVEILNKIKVKTGDKLDTSYLFSKKLLPRITGTYYYCSGQQVDMSKMTEQDSSLEFWHRVDRQDTVFLRFSKYPFVCINNEGGQTAEWNFLNYRALAKGPAVNEGGDMDLGAGAEDVMGEMELRLDYVEFAVMSGGERRQNAVKGDSSMNCMLAQTFSLTSTDNIKNLNDTLEVHYSLRYAGGEFKLVATIVDTNNKVVGSLVYDLPDNIVSGDTLSIYKGGVNFMNPRQIVGDGSAAGLLIQRMREISVGKKIRSVIGSDSAFLAGIGGQLGFNENGSLAMKIPPAAGELVINPDEVKDGMMCVTVDNFLDYSTDKHVQDSIKYDAEEKINPQQTMLDNKTLEIRGANQALVAAKGDSIHWRDSLDHLEKAKPDDTLDDAQKAILRARILEVEESWKTDTTQLGENYRQLIIKMEIFNDSFRNIIILENKRDGFMAELKIIIDNDGTQNILDVLGADLQKMQNDLKELDELIIKDGIKRDSFYDICKSIMFNMGIATEEMVIPLYDEYFNNNKKLGDEWKEAQRQHNEQRAALAIKITEKTEELNQQQALLMQPPQEQEKGLLKDSINKYQGLVDDKIPGSIEAYRLFYLADSAFGATWYKASINYFKIDSLRRELDPVANWRSLKDSAAVRRHRAHVKFVETAAVIYSLTKECDKIKHLIDSLTDKMNKDIANVQNSGRLRRPYESVSGVYKGSDNAKVYQEFLKRKHPRVDDGEVIEKLPEGADVHWFVVPSNIVVDGTYVAGTRTYDYELGKMEYYTKEGGVLKQLYNTPVIMRVPGTRKSGTCVSLEEDVKRRDYTDDYYTSKKRDSLLLGRFGCRSAVKDLPVRWQGGYPDNGFYSLNFYYKRDTGRNAPPMRMYTVKLPPEVFHKREVDTVNLCDKRYQTGLVYTYNAGSREWNYDSTAARAYLDTLKILPALHGAHIYNNAPVYYRHMKKVHKNLYIVKEPAKNNKVAYPHLCFAGEKDMVANRNDIQLYPVQGNESVDKIVKMYLPGVNARLKSEDKDTIENGNFGCLFDIEGNGYNFYNAVKEKTRVDNRDIFISMNIDRGQYYDFKDYYRSVIDLANKDTLTVYQVIGRDIDTFYNKKKHAKFNTWMQNAIYKYGTERNIANRNDLEAAVAAVRNFNLSASNLTHIYDVLIREYLDTFNMKACVAMKVDTGNKKRNWYADMEDVSRDNAHSLVSTPAENKRLTDLRCYLRKLYWGGKDRKQAIPGDAVKGIPRYEMTLRYDSTACKVWGIIDSFPDCRISHQPVGYNNVHKIEWQAYPKLRDQMNKYGGDTCGAQKDSTIAERLEQAYAHPAMKMDSFGCVLDSLIKSDSIKHVQSDGDTVKIRVDSVLRRTYANCLNMKDYLVQLCDVQYRPAINGGKNCTLLATHCKPYGCSDPATGAVVGPITKKSQCATNETYKNAYRRMYGRSVDNDTVLEVHRCMPNVGYVDDVCYFTSSFSGKTGLSTVSFWYNGYQKDTAKLTRRPAYCSISYDTLGKMTAGNPNAALRDSNLKDIERLKNGIIEFEIAGLYVADNYDNNTNLARHHAFTNLEYTSTAVKKYQDYYKKIRKKVDSSVYGNQGHSSLRFSDVSALYNNFHSMKFNGELANVYGNVVASRRALDSVSLWVTHIKDIYRLNPTVKASNGEFPLNEKVDSICLYKALLVALMGHSYAYFYYDNVVTTASRGITAKNVTEENYDAALDYMVKINKYAEESYGKMHSLYLLLRDSIKISDVNVSTINAARPSQYRFDIDLIDNMVQIDSSRLLVSKLRSVSFVNKDKKDSTNFSPETACSVCPEVYQYMWNRTRSIVDAPPSPSIPIWRKHCCEAHISTDYGETWVNLKGKSVEVKGCDSVPHKCGCMYTCKELDSSNNTERELINQKSVCQQGQGIYSGYYFRVIPNKSIRDSEFYYEKNIYDAAVDDKIVIEVSKPSGGKSCGQADKKSKIYIIYDKENKKYEYGGIPKGSNLGDNIVMKDLIKTGAIRLKPVPDLPDPLTNDYSVKITANTKYSLTNYVYPCKKFPWNATKAVGGGKTVSVYRWWKYGYKSETDPNGITSVFEANNNNLERGGVNLEGNVAGEMSKAYIVINLARKLGALFLRDQELNGTWTNPATVVNKVPPFCWVRPTMDKQDISTYTDYDDNETYLKIRTANRNDGYDKWKTFLKFTKDETVLDYPCENKDCGYNKYYTPKTKSNADVERKRYSKGQLWALDFQNGKDIQNEILNGEGCVCLPAQQRYNLNSEPSAFICAFKEDIEHVYDVNKEKVAFKLRQMDSVFTKDPSKAISYYQDRATFYQGAKILENESVKKYLNRYGYIPQYRALKDQVSMVDKGKRNISIMEEDDVFYGEKTGGGKVVSGENFILDHIAGALAVMGEPGAQRYVSVMQKKSLRSGALDEDDLEFQQGEGAADNAALFMFMQSTQRNRSNLDREHMKLINICVRESMVNNIKEKTGNEEEMYTDGKNVQEPLSGPYGTKCAAGFKLASILVAGTETDKLVKDAAVQLQKAKPSYMLSEYPRPALKAPEVPPFNVPIPSAEFNVQPENSAMAQICLTEEEKDEGNKEDNGLSPTPPNMRPDENFDLPSVSPKDIQMNARVEVGDQQDVSRLVVSSNKFVGSLVSISPYALPIFIGGLAALSPLLILLALQNPVMFTMPSGTGGGGGFGGNMGEVNVDGGWLEVGVIRGGNGGDGSGGHGANTGGMGGNGGHGGYGGHIDKTVAVASGTFILQKGMRGGNGGRGANGGVGADAICNAGLENRSGGNGGYGGSGGGGGFGGTLSISGGDSVYIHEVKPGSGGSGGTGGAGGAGWNECRGATAAVMLPGGYGGNGGHGGNGGRAPEVRIAGGNVVIGNKIYGPQYGGLKGGKGGSNGGSTTLAEAQGKEGEDGRKGAYNSITITGGNVKTVNSETRAAMYATPKDASARPVYSRQVVMSGIGGGMKPQELTIDGVTGINLLETLIEDGEEAYTEGYGMQDIKTFREDYQHIVTGAKFSTGVFYFWLPYAKDSIIKLDGLASVTPHVRVRMSDCNNYDASWILRPNLQDNGVVATPTVAVTEVQYYRLKGTGKRKEVCYYYDAAGNQKCDSVPELVSEHMMTDQIDCGVDSLVLWNCEDRGYPEPIICQICDNDSVTYQDGWAMNRDRLNNFAGDKVYETRDTAWKEDATKLLVMPVSTLYARCVPQWKRIKFSANGGNFVGGNVPNKFDSMSVWNIGGDSLRSARRDFKRGQIGWGDTTPAISNGDGASFVGVVPVRSGYTFKGYYTNPVLGQGIRYYDANGNRDTSYRRQSWRNIYWDERWQEKWDTIAVLYAQWEPISTKLYFYAKDPLRNVFGEFVDTTAGCMDLSTAASAVGGLTAPRTQTVRYGEPMPKLYTSTCFDLKMKGYVFKGYYRRVGAYDMEMRYDDTLGVSPNYPVWNPVTVVTVDTLYARWEPLKIYIRYDVAGGRDIGNTMWLTVSEASYNTNNFIVAQYKNYSGGYHKHISVYPGDTIETSSECYGGGRPTGSICDTFHNMMCCPNSNENWCQSEGYRSKCGYVFKGWSVFASDTVARSAMFYATGTCRSTDLCNSQRDIHVGHQIVDVLADAGMMPRNGDTISLYAVWTPDTSRISFKDHYYLVETTYNNCSWQWSPIPGTPGMGICLKKGSDRSVTNNATVIYGAVLPVRQTTGGEFPSAPSGYDNYSYAGYWKPYSKMNVIRQDYANTMYYLSDGYPNMYQKWNSWRKRDTLYARWANIIYNIEFVPTGPIAGAPPTDFRPTSGFVPGTLLKTNIGFSDAITPLNYTGTVPVKMDGWALFRDADQAEFTPSKTIKSLGVIQNDTVRLYPVIKALNIIPYTCNPAVNPGCVQGGGQGGGPSGSSSRAQGASGADGGALQQLATIKIKYGQNISDITSRLYVPPVYSGYTFMGYYHRVTGERYFDSVFRYVKGEYWLDTSLNVSLVTMWRFNRYDISYDVSGSAGVAPEGHVGVRYSDNVRLRSYGGRKYGYTHRGWSLSEDGSGNVYLADSAVRNLTGNDGVTVTLHSVWKPKQTVLTFSQNTPNNGATGGQYWDLTATFDSLVPVLTSRVICPTRTGYDFKGYKAGGDNGAKYYDSVGNPVRVWDIDTVKVMLYAKWEAKRYNIIYDVGGGSASAPAGFNGILYDSSIVLQPYFGEKVGHTFGGWTRTAGSKTAEYTAGSGRYSKIGSSSSTVTLYAAWVPYVTRLSFDANTGIGSMGVANAEYGLPMPNVHLSISKRGYDFVGFYDSAAGGLLYYYSRMLSARNWDREDASGVLYAHWEAKTTILKFDANGGVGAPSPVVIRYDEQLPELAAPSRVGYEFKGYYDSEHFHQAVQYYDSAGVRLRIWDRLETEITLYARWVARKSALEFDFQGGSCECLVADEVSFGNNMPWHKPLPTYEGYVFEGYYDEPDGGVQYYDRYGNGVRVWEKSVVSATLYARWTGATYGITYRNMPEGTINLPADTFRRGTGLVLVPPSHNQYDFAGFYWDSAAAGNAVTAITSVDTGSKVLYGKWTYSVIYDRNHSEVGGTDVASSVLVYNDAGNAIKAVPVDWTLYGYEPCLGWSESPDAVEAQCPAVGCLASAFTVNRVVRLYAVWRALKSRIIYVAISEGSGITAGGSDTVVVYGSSMPAASPPQREGYVFDGYYDEHGVKYYDGSGAGVRVWDRTDAEVTLYGRWISSGSKNLTGLVANGATLYPSFSPTTYEYRLVLPCGDANLVLNYDDNVSVRVNGQLVENRTYFIPEMPSYEMIQIAVNADGKTVIYTLLLDIPLPNDYILYDPLVSSVSMEVSEELSGNPDFVRYRWYENGVLVGNSEQWQLLRYPHLVSGAVYSVTVMAANGDSVRICGRTAEYDDSHDEQLVALPNPATTTITLTHPSLGQETTVIRIYTISGQLVLSYTVEQGSNNAIQIDISALSSGTYAVKVLNTTKIITKN